MYTVNPFRHEGRAASDLSSTHPPISERIRILRSMAGAAPANYEQAYRQVKGSGVMPASALVAAGAVPLRPATAEKEDAEALIGRTRETSDLLWRKEGYRSIPCPCGATLRVPPTFKGKSVKCPHCGAIHGL